MDLTTSEKQNGSHVDGEYLKNAISANKEMFAEIDFENSPLGVIPDCLEIARTKIDNEQFVREMIRCCDGETSEGYQRVIGNVFYERVGAQLCAMYMKKLKSHTADFSSQEKEFFVKRQVERLGGSTIMHLLTINWEVYYAGE